MKTQTKTFLKLILVSFILIILAQSFLKGINEYNSISFIFGGLTFSIYELIAKKIQNKKSEFEQLNEGLVDFIEELKKFEDHENTKDAK